MGGGGAEKIRGELEKSLKILAKFISSNLFYEVRPQNFATKMGHSGVFYLIRSYAKNIQSVTDIIISKTAPYIAQQTLRRVVYFLDECLFECLKRMKTVFK